MNNLMAEMMVAAQAAKAKYGRRALVGQFVREEGGHLIDTSARVNFDRSKKYPHSSRRQNERAARQRARKAARFA